jgi:hypothetical protein
MPNEESNKTNFLWRDGDAIEDSILTNENPEIPKINRLPL